MSASIVLVKLARPLISPFGWIYLHIYIHTTRSSFPPYGTLFLPSHILEKLNSLTCLSMYSHHRQGEVCWIPTHSSSIIRRRRSTNNDIGKLYYYIDSQTPDRQRKDQGEFMDQHFGCQDKCIKSSAVGASDIRHTHTNTLDLGKFRPVFIENYNGLATNGRWGERKKDFFGFSFLSGPLVAVV